MIKKKKNGIIHMFTERVKWSCFRRLAVGFYVFFFYVHAFGGRLL